MYKTLKNRKKQKNWKKKTEFLKNLRKSQISLGGISNWCSLATQLKAVENIFSGYFPEILLFSILFFLFLSVFCIFHKENL